MSVVISAQNHLSGVGVISDNSFCINSADKYLNPSDRIKLCPYSAPQTRRAIKNENAARAVPAQ